MIRESMQQLGKNVIKGKTVLVTGGAGFIGSHLADRLVEKGNKVAVIDDLSTGKKSNLNKRAAFYKVDVGGPKVSQIFKKERPDVVFHFAAHIEARESVKNPVFDAKANILTTLNLLENCRRFKVKKIIFASSGGEIYGRAKEIPTSETYLPAPLSPYGVAKLAVEGYLYSYSKVHNLPFAALRFGNIYGPRQNPYGEAGVVAIFTNKMLKGEQPFIHGDGRQTKDYLFIDDAIRAVVLVLEKGFNGIVNIGTGKETSVMGIFKKIKRLTGSKVKEKHVPFPSIGFDRGCLSIKKAKKELDWEPKIGFEEGIEKTVEWFKSVIK